MTTTTEAPGAGAADIDKLRQRVDDLRHDLYRYWVDKQDIVDLMIVCSVAQEPLLLVGPPGTAKSDMIVKFAQAISLDTQSKDYFEYMLTQFTEPSEIVGPIDINELKEGRYIRRIGGKLPEAKLVFLDEIFKSNSAILNTLLTIINERKFYQDGRPEKVAMRMLFAATNEIPQHTELDALRDRFTLKVESRPVAQKRRGALLHKGLQNEIYGATNRRPWAGRLEFSALEQLKTYLDELLAGEVRDGEHERARVFPDPVYREFERILKTLEKEFEFTISDRKFIKLYKLLRARAFLFGGGRVRRGDLVLLRYVADRLEDMQPMKQLVDRMLELE